MPNLPPVEDDTPAAAVLAPSRDGVPSGLETQLWWQHIGDRVPGPSEGRASSELTRLALDLRRQWNLTSQWRSGWSSRLDLVHALRQDPGAGEHDRSLHSLREAWLSWRQPHDESVLFVDGGRINWRLGSAGGFNPTDFFKRGAARAISNADPRATRLDRLGVVMLRIQSVLPAGGWTLAVAPRLTRRTEIDNRIFALALERTNDNASALFKWSPQWSQEASVDASLFLRQGEQAQAGLSTSWLPTPSLVLHAEWAGGKRVSLAGPTEPVPVAAWRNRLSTGGAWTAAAGWELMFEYQYAGDALTRGDWNDWRSVDSGADLQRLGEMARERAYLREPLVRSGVFARVAWRDAFELRGVDLSAFVQLNRYDSSRLWQTRAAWRLAPRWSLIGLAGGADGARGSEYGSYSPRRHVAFYLTHFH